MVMGCKPFLIELLDYRHRTVPRQGHSGSFEAFWRLPATEVGSTEFRGHGIRARRTPGFANPRDVRKIESLEFVSNVYLVEGEKGDPVQHPRRDRAPEARGGRAAAQCHAGATGLSNATCPA